MASYAKLTGLAALQYEHHTNFPSDYWGQVDVWIPPTTFTACDGDLFAFTSTFLHFILDGLFATDVTPPTGAWRWWSDSNPGGPAATGPSPSTTYTIEFHTYPSGSDTGIDWYVNGTLVFSYVRTGSFPGHQIQINLAPEGCCCEVYYYTNVKISTTRGAGDIFSDDFSGGLGNWTNLNAADQPGAAAVVSSTSSAPCPTLSISPSSGQPGDTITITGTGYAAGSPVTFYVGNSPVITGTADGSGNVSITTTLPHVPTNDSFGPSNVYLVDDAANVGCGTLNVCGTRPSDGITTAPNVYVQRDVGQVVSEENIVLDYIFHDDAHWILWQDPTNVSAPGTFPPATNHTLNATRISADGSSVTDYPIDTGYFWEFGTGSDDDPGLGSSRSCPGGATPAAPVWSSHVWFSSWQKPIYDARFASDGTTLWVGVVTAETIEYPWLDNKDEVSPNPGSLNQYVPLATLTSGFTNFATGPSGNGMYYLRYWTTTDGPINFYKQTAFPITDAGAANMGVWAPPVVAMFSFDGSAFNRIGSIEAIYCPGIDGTDGYKHTHDGIIGPPIQNQQSPRGALYSRVSMCASENDPGVCHVVWSEGGDWGRVGDGDACTVTNLPISGGTAITWDCGPVNRSYRVNYSRWDSAGSIFSNDISSSHQDRTSWEFTSQVPGDGPPSYQTGYTWPAQANFAGILAHDLRNDNAAGKPYLFAAIPQSIQNGLLFPTPDTVGDPWLDNAIVFSDTLHVYDLSSGSAVQVQVVNLGTLGTTQDEMLAVWAGFNFTGNNIDPTRIGPADSVYSPTEISETAVSSFGVISKAFGISLPYDDPELGVPVYLVHVPLLRRYTFDNNGDEVPSGIGAAIVSRNFFRVPCDMSAGFDYLDGVRQVEFTIIRNALSGFSYTFDGADFFSDPNNIWVPAPGSVYNDFAGYDGFWFDRVCLNTWVGFNSAWTPNVNDYWPGAICAGFYYDPDADAISTASPSPDNPGSFGTYPLAAVTTQFICRGCNSCKCGTGVRVVQRA